LKTLLSENFGLSSVSQLAIYEIFEKNLNEGDKVVIFGSRALGNYRNYSDIDFCIFSSSMKYNNLLNVELEIENLMIPFKVDLILFSQIENESLKKHILECGIQFFPKL
jgi:uncharacterized protein